MALPSSGQISFNDVRTEMSQSIMTNYEMGNWTWGGGLPTIICSGVGYEGYAPINVLSSGSRFSQSSPLRHQNLSMSAWYDYDHTTYIGLDITGTLYQHANIPDYCYPSTMLIIDVGTTNMTLSINVSGTLDYPGTILAIFYGKPWFNNGGSNYPFNSIWSDIGTFGNTITQSIAYEYTYNSDSGSKLYCVLANGCTS